MASYKKCCTMVFDTQNQCKDFNGTKYITVSKNGQIKQKDFGRL